jgi:hypothetical protein
MANETSSLDKGFSQELENARPNPDISMQPGLPTHLNTPAYRRGMRKVDIYVTGVVLLLYLFAFLDKANLGNARVEGLQKVSISYTSVPRSSGYRLAEGRGRRLPRPRRCSARLRALSTGPGALVQAVVFGTHQFVSSLHVRGGTLVSSRAEPKLIAVLHRFPSTSCSSASVCNYICII